MIGQDNIKLLKECERPSAVFVKLWREKERWAQIYKRGMVE